MPETTTVSSGGRAEAPIGAATAAEADRDDNKRIREKTARTKRKKRKQTKQKRNDTTKDRHDAATTTVTATSFSTTDGSIPVQSRRTPSQQQQQEEADNERAWTTSTHHDNDNNDDKHKSLQQEQQPDPASPLIRRQNTESSSQPGAFRCAPAVEAVAVEPTRRSTDPTASSSPLPSSPLEEETEEADDDEEEDRFRTKLVSEWTNNNDYRPTSRHVVLDEEGGSGSDGDVLSNSTRTEKKKKNGKKTGIVTKGISPRKGGPRPSQEEEENSSPHPQYNNQKKTTTHHPIETDEENTILSVPPPPPLQPNQRLPQRPGAYCSESGRRPSRSPIVITQTDTSCPRRPLPQQQQEQHSLPLQEQHPVSRLTSSSTNSSHQSAILEANVQRMEQLNRVILLPNNGDSNDDEEGSQDDSNDHNRRNSNYNNKTHKQDDQRCIVWMYGVVAGLCLLLVVSGAIAVTIVLTSSNSNGGGDNNKSRSSSSTKNGRIGDRGNHHDNTPTQHQNVFIFAVQWGYTALGCQEVITKQAFLSLECKSNERTAGREGNVPPQILDQEVTTTTRSNGKGKNQNNDNNNNNNTATLDCSIDGSNRFLKCNPTATTPSLSSPLSSFPLQFSTSLLVGCAGSVNTTRMVLSVKTRDDLQGRQCGNLIVQNDNDRGKPPMYRSKLSSGTSIGHFCSSSQATTDLEYIQWAPRRRLCQRPARIVPISNNNDDGSSDIEVCGYAENCRNEDQPCSLFAPFDFLAQDTITTLPDKACFFRGQQTTATRPPPTTTFSLFDHKDMNLTKMWGLVRDSFEVENFAQKVHHTLS